VRAAQDGEVRLANRPAEMPAAAADTVDAYVTNDHHRFGLQKMGLMTALAIGIHNLPEGLATFVAALADPLSGVAIAVAIALHNIPEGVCVAMPVYYATGSRAKGFLWAFLSGVSEPIGGLLGYLVLYGNRMSDLAYGILFCVVAGMMVRFPTLVAALRQSDTSTCRGSALKCAAATVLQLVAGADGSGSTRRAAALRSASAACGLPRGSALV
jgi:ZIP Zinc transporter